MLVTNPYLHRFSPLRELVCSICAVSVSALFPSSVFINFAVSLLSPAFLLCSFFSYYFCSLRLEYAETYFEQQISTNQENICRYSSLTWDTTKSQSNTNVLAKTKKRRGITELPNLYRVWWKVLCCCFGTQDQYCRFIQIDMVLRSA